MGSRLMGDSPQSQLDAEREKNRLLSDIVNAIPEPILAKNWEGNFVFANSYVAKLYGTTPEEMIGKEDSFFTGNKEQGRFFKENVQSVMRRFEPETVYEDSTDSNTGEVRHYQSLKIPFKNSNGEPNVAVIARDITEITELKNLAEFNSKRLELVLSVSREGMWDWNTETNVVLFSKGWERITGINRSRGSFSYFMSRIVEDDKQRVADALEALLEKNTPYEIEFRFNRPDGEVIWLWDRGSIVEYDEEGKPLLLAGIVQDVTQQKINQSEIESLAFYDSLTSLPNRALLNDRLGLALDRCKRSGKCGAVLFLDLDNFKYLNDTYGHQAGDDLLMVLGGRLNSLVRGDDTVARFGGDEFVIVLNELDVDPRNAAAQAKLIAKDIRSEIGKNISITLNENRPPINYAITASIGITIFEPGLKEASELLQLADLALYQAKSKGKDDSAVFDPVIQEEIDKTARLEKELWASLAQGDFVLHYQPQYDENLNLVSAEALIRWAHPERGLLSPSDFMAVVEGTNLISPIGDWVLAEACRQLKEWQSDSRYQHLRMSINISAKQVWSGDFVTNVKRIVSESGIDRSMLKLEITETVLLGDTKEIIEKLNELVDFGLSFSLDDFGTGYSSLNYLKHLPINELKVDHSFTRDLLDDEMDLVMVKSIIAMGKNFGISVVAEGVEKGPHLEVLKGLGCDLYQGNYFSRPVPVSEFTGLVDGKVQAHQEA
ncbi:EAL domain-containing protein [Marinobacter sp. 1_MG-2023]|uniref:EAL domain-containing protein n=1 Tax=Marinobacter sp. 1_MG-2023 TaxID=3062627 RepID=UPI0026E12147|nr:EAL domain-containing protein [Marinobacter sp. 1_MG-2023]MDO6822931.1 EAL domain-containing protein [Marinobacter sp. 1_MG-2023]